MDRLAPADLQPVGQDLVAALTQHGGDLSVVAAVG
jgi:hypothetical protein